MCPADLRQCQAPTGMGEVGARWGYPWHGTGGGELPCSISPPARWEPGLGRAAPVGDTQSWRCGYERCQPHPGASSRRNGATRTWGRVSPGGSRAPLTGAEVAFYLVLFCFLSWKLVKDSAETMLDPGGEMTWDTERGQQPPWAGLMSCQAECDLPAPEHHPPSPPHTQGCRS